ncbi:MAG: hypothetical protein EHM33_18925 [Chloroflexi bacterium]|nr:MAG: hypothetical protein EHM33_18925 [Chloroflexota bacterium]
MKRWQGSCVGALLVLLIGGSSLIFLVPFGGAMIAAMPPVFDRLTAYVLCSDATDYSYNDYNFGVPTTSSPGGGTGHYTELTCTYADGSQKVFGNEEVGLKGLAASFSAAGICGGVAVLFLMTLAAVIGARLAKPKVT